MSSEVETPQLAGAEDVAWNLVIDLANAGMPTWVLAGGLMVHLHLYEAGVTPRRATTDVDAIVDVNLQVARAGTAAFAIRLVEEFGMHLQVAPGLGAGRHLRDAADLVAVVADPDAVQPTPRQRRRLRGLLHAPPPMTHP